MPGATCRSKHTILAQVILVPGKLGYVLLYLGEAQPGVSDNFVEVFHVGSFAHDREVLETIGLTHPVRAA